MPYAYTPRMAKAFKKVTVNLPVQALENALRATGKGITPTIVEGLLQIERNSRRSALRDLRGKIHLELDLESTRR
jgi:hypothetical protein